jgi:predicted DNA repair protein MutK
MRFVLAALLGLVAVGLVVTAGVGGAWHQMFHLGDVGYHAIVGLLAQHGITGRKLVHSLPGQ